MIPQRRLARTGFGNGVSCRVEACRRRLRVVRATEAHAKHDDSAAETVDADGIAGEATINTVAGLETRGQDEAEIT